MTTSPKTIRISAILLILIGTFVVGGNTSTHAQVVDSKGNVNNPTPSYTLLEPLPCIPTADKPCTTATITSVTFQDYVQYVFDLAIAVAAFAAVFMIIWGGFQYMSTDAWEQKSEGIKKLKNAVLGLLLILSSYLILKTIDPRLVNIPTSLVKPLAIKYENTTNSYLAGLQKQVAQFKVDYNNALQTVISANTKIDAYAKQQDTALQQIKDLSGTDNPFDACIGVTADNDPELNKACNDYYNATDGISKQLGIAATATAAGTIANLLGEAIRLPQNATYAQDTAYLADSKIKIQNAFNAAAQTLRDQGYPTDESGNSLANKLSDQYNLALAKIDITQSLIKYNQQEGISPSHSNAIIMGLSDSLSDAGSVIYGAANIVALGTISTAYNATKDYVGGNTGIDSYGIAANKAMFDTYNSYKNQLSDASKLDLLKTIHNVSIAPK